MNASRTDAFQPDDDQRRDDSPMGRPAEQQLASTLPPSGTAPSEVGRETDGLPATTAPADRNATRSDGIISEQVTSAYVPLVSAPHSGPTRIGKFRILRELGQGGMGTVYEALQEDVQRRVALKVPGRLSEADQRRFEWEARILAQFQDPGIATLYEHGVAPDDRGESRQYFAMELIEGKTLTAHVEQAGLSIRDKVELLRRVAHAVGQAHRRGIVHRDLKPGNILVDAEANPRILDFGVARFTEGRPAELQTISGQIVGTIAYMAPEQARGESDQANAACDVYALGTILYELLAGRHPRNLKGLSLLQMLAVIENETPTPLGKLDRRLAGDLELIVDKAMRKEPESRYATATELADDLGRWLEHAPIVARRLTLGYQLQKLAQRHRLLTSAAAVVLLIAVIATGMILNAWKDERRARSEAEERRVQAVAARDAEASARRGELEQALVRHQQRGDWKAVLDVVDRLEGLDGVDRDLIATDRAAALFVLGRYDEAQAIVGELGGRDAQLKACQARARLYRGLLAQTADGDSKEARRLMEQALESTQLSPGDAKFAQAFLATTRDDVERLLREGLKAEPFNYLCLSHLTLLLVTSGEEVEAESFVTLGEQLFPYDPRIFESRLALNMRSASSRDPAKLREEFERRMDPAEVKRVMNLVQTNLDIYQMFDKLLDAAIDGDTKRTSELQREMTLSLPRIFASQAGRRSSLVAPLPGIDPGYRELMAKAPLAALGIGRESFFEQCRERFRTSQDPLLVFFAFFTRVAGLKEMSALSTEKLQELADLLAEGAARPCILRRVPQVLRFSRLAFLRELLRRAEVAGDRVEAARRRNEVVADSRLLLASSLLSPKQRQAVMAALFGLDGKAVEVRDLGDNILAATPDEASARVVVAMMEVLLGNPGRAEQLLQKEGLESQLEPALRASRNAVLARVQGIRTEQLAAAQQTLESRRQDALREILELSRSYDRLGRRPDAEQSALAARALADQMLADAGTAPAAKPALSARSRAYTLGSRAVARWRLSDYDGACEDSLAAIAADPTDQWHYYVAAPRLLLAGRRDDYLRVTRECLAKFGESDDPSLCERTAKIGLLAPGTELSDAVCAAADRSWNNGKKHPYWEYFRLVAGMADVRRGRYDAVQGAKGAPFASNFYYAKFLRLPAVLLHALGAAGTPAEPEARQRLLEVAPYFSRLEQPLLAHDHDLMGQVLLYREAAAKYQLESVLNWLRTAEWRRPPEMRAVDFQGRLLSAAADESLRGEVEPPSESTAFHFRGSGPVAAVRFEALPDPKLPHNGPGTNSSTGRCKISEIRVTRVRDNKVEPVGIAWALPAGAEPPQGMIGRAFDDDRVTDWGPDHDDRLGQSLDGVFVLAQSVTLDEGEELCVEIKSRTAFGIPVRMRIRTTPDSPPSLGK